MAAKPTIAKFCPTFLKADMLHIYRQVTGLQRYRPLVLARKRESADRFPFDESRVHLLPRPPLRFLRRAWHRQLCQRPIPPSAAEIQSTLQAMESHQARLLHIYFGNVAGSLLPLIRSSPVPVVVSIHGADATVEMDRPRFRAAMIEALDRARLVFARSESLLDSLEELGCDRAKLRLQRTGLPLDDWPFLKRAIPPGGGRWEFLQVCRIVPKKGIATTLRAFAAIRARHPAARLTIAGDGPALEEMVALATDLGIGGAVTFPGFTGQNQVQSLCRRAHFFFHPSETDAEGNREGVPNAMLEAMATGLPALATRHAGIPEAVSEGQSGHLAEERDHESLAAAALKSMADPARYQQLARGARQAVEDAFSSPVSIATLESLYDEAIGLR